MSEYKDGLDAIHALLGDVRIHAAIQTNKVGDVVDRYMIIHHHRWLIYRDAGLLVDPDDIGETVTLGAADDAGWTSYDLAQVEWLTPGRLYQVRNVHACFEDYEAFS